MAQVELTCHHISEANGAESNKSIVYTVHILPLLRSSFILRFRPKISIQLSFANVPYSTLD